MARSRFNFDRYLTDSITVYSLNAAIQSDGGMKSAPAVRHADIKCAFQPIRGDKVLEFQQMNILASHVALTNVVYADLKVGDFFIDQSGLTYDITYFEAEGGAKNPVGVVFAIYGKLRLNR